MKFFVLVFDEWVADHPSLLYAKSVRLFMERNCCDFLLPIYVLCLLVMVFIVGRKLVALGRDTPQSELFLTLSFRVCLRQEKIYIMGDVGKRIAIAVPFR